MSEIYSIKLDGSEVARISGESIVSGKKVADKSWRDVELVDDPRMLRIVREGKTVAVFYVSTAENVSVEKVLSE